MCLGLCVEDRGNPKWLWEELTIFSSLRPLPQSGLHLSRFQALCVYTDKALHYCQTPVITLVGFGRRAGGHFSVVIYSLFSFLVIPAHVCGPPPNPEQSPSDSAPSHRMSPGGGFSEGPRGLQQMGWPTNSLDPSRWSHFADGNPDAHVTFPKDVPGNIPCLECGGRPQSLGTKRGHSHVLLDNTVGKERAKFPGDFSRRHVRFTCHLHQGEHRKK